MMNQIMVSVIIPCFNCERYINDTLISIQRQTYKSWEAIIVDDFSTDRSRDIVNKFVLCDSRFKLIERSNNSGGPSLPRNDALRLARGNFVAFCDSDDIWLPEKLELQLAFSFLNNYDITSTSYLLIDAEGANLDKVILAEEFMDYRKYLKNTSIGFSTVLIKRDLLDGVLFRQYSVAEDFGFWLDLFKRGVAMHGLRLELTKYRVHNNSLSSNKFKSAAQVWLIYRKQEGFNLIRSAFFFLNYAFNAIKKRL